MTHTAESLASAITSWDRENITDLLDLIKEFEGLRDEDGDEYRLEDYVDMASLPTAPIPDDIDTSYPVWAVDQNGMALVGTNADEVESLDEIRDWYKENR